MSESIMILILVSLSTLMSMVAVVLSVINLRTMRNQYRNIEGYQLSNLQINKLLAAKFALGVEVGEGNRGPAPLGATQENPLGDAVLEEDEA